MDGKELDIQHITDLIKVAVNQVQFAVTDAVRHAVAHLGVEYDHPSAAVVKKELLTQVSKKLEEHWPEGPHPQYLEQSREPQPSDEAMD